MHAYHAIIHGNKWLELRNHIKIDFNTLEVGLNESILDMSGKINKRIITEYAIVGGMFIIKYRDTKYNKYITQDEVDEILENENNSQIIHQKEEEEETRKKQEFDVVKSILRDRIGQDDDVIITEVDEYDNTSNFNVRSNDTYENTMINVYDMLYDY